MDSIYLGAPFSDAFDGVFEKGKEILNTLKEHGIDENSILSESENLFDDYYSDPSKTKSYDLKSLLDINWIDQIFEKDEAKVLNNAIVRGDHTTWNEGDLDYIYRGFLPQRYMKEYLESLKNPSDYESPNSMESYNA